MSYTSIVSNWNSYPTSNFNVAIAGTQFDAAGDLASNADLVKDANNIALYSRFDTSTGTKYLLLRAAVNSSFSQKLIINFDVNTGTGFDNKIDFALVADLGALPNGYSSGTPVADGIFAAGSQSGSLNTRPNNTDFYLSATQSVQNALKIADSAIAKTTVGSDTYVDIIINFSNFYTLLQDASSVDGDAQVVASAYPTFDENTPIRFALTSSANLNNVNKDISGTSTNDLTSPWSAYLSSPASISNLVAGAPSISSVPENGGGGINATEASDGTTVNVSLSGTNALAGDTVTLSWGGQTVSYVLTASDITNGTAPVPVSAATITAQGNGTFNVTAKIGSGPSSAPFSVTVDTVAPSAPSISSVPENAGGGINATEATDGTTVNVSLSGTNAIAGDTLTLLWGGQSVSYVLTASDITNGTAPVPVSAAIITAQGNGTFNITTSITDQAGNSSPASSPFSVTVDTAAPSVPSISSVPENAGGGINSAEASDGTTVNVSLSGTNAAAGDTVTLNWGGQPVSYVLTAGDITNGTAAVFVSAATITAQGDGTFNVTATITDQAGNSSPASSPFSVTVDTVSPSAPSISSVPENAGGGINSAEASDGTTVNVSLSGTNATAGDTVTLNWGGQPVSYVLTAGDIANGTAAIPISAATITAQGDGTFDVTLQIGSGPISDPFSVKVDTVAPSAPSISSVPENSGGGINATEASDGTTVNVSLSGTNAIAGDTVTLNWGGQSVSYVLTASDIANGTAPVPVSTATITAQGDGTFDVTATITDQAGNSSPDSSPFSVTVDTVAPSAPSISSVPENAGGGINATEATDGTTVNVSLSGTNAIAGDTLTLLWGGQSVSYVLTASDITNGTATVPVSAATITAQGNGTFNITTSITDQAGNSSPVSSPFSVTVDTAAPSAPSISSVPENAGGGINATEASDGTTVNVSLSGSGAAAGDSITLLWGGQSVSYVLTASDITNGTAPVPVSAATLTAQGDGTFNVTATITDQAGNSSPASSPFSVTVDTVSPSAPSISSVPENAGGGINSAEASDGTTVNVSLSGTNATAGDTVTLNWGGQPVSYVLTAGDIANGTAAIPISAATITAQGDGTFDVTLQIGSGPISDPFSVKVDTVAPSAPSISSVPENSGGGINATEASDGTTVNVSLSGTNAVSGDSITLLWGGQSVSYALTASDITNGSAAVPVSASTITAQGNGTFDVTAQLTDQAGNTSPVSSPVSVTVDTVAPTAPSISSIPENANGGLNTIEANDGTTVNVNISSTGAVAGDSITLLWGSQSTSYVLTASDITNGTAAVPVSDSTLSTEGNGTFNVTAQLTDQTGNTSPVSSPVLVTVDTVQPFLTTATVNGSIVTLTYSETLSGSPSISDYTITVNNVSATFSAIAIAGNSVTLTLTSPVDLADAVFVGYTRPSSSALQDIVGNLANSLVNQPVTNTMGDTTAPAVVSVTPSVPTVTDATVGTGTFTITVVYSEAMDSNVNPTLSFPTVGENPSPTLSFVSGSWSNSTTYVATYTVTDSNTSLSNVDVQVLGAKDLSGNTQVTANRADLFSIDTANPSVILSSTASATVNGAFTVTASFSEAVTGFTSSDITLVNGTVTTTPTSTDGGLNYSFTVSPTADGSVSVAIDPNRVVDSASNGNLASTGALTRIADLTPPPSSSGGDLSSGSDTGDANDGLTNDSTPNIVGTAEPNNTVNVYNGTTLLGSTLTDTNGQWVFTPLTPLSDGTYSLTTTVTDAGGNTSAPSAPFEITVDTAAPLFTIDSSNAPTADNPQGSLVLVFNEAIQGFDLDDLVLTYDGAPVSLSGATLSTEDGVTWRLSNIASLPEGNGSFDLSLSESVTVSDRAGNSLTRVSPATWAAEACHSSLPVSAINFQTGSRGFRRQGTNSKNRLAGSRRNDILNGLRGNDILKGRNGGDRLKGGGSKDRLVGQAGNDKLLGNRGNDRLKGGSGRDWLDGGAKNDRLSGGSGDDILLGGKGFDFLTGGTGQDMFVFRSLTDGVDHITDFNPTIDRLDLRSILNQPNFVGDGVNTFSYQLIQTVQVGADTEVRIDQDGFQAGTAFTTIAILDNVQLRRLDCSNFVLEGEACELGTPVRRIKFQNNGKGLRRRIKPNQTRLRGAGYDDRLTGAIGNDRMVGNGGNDRLTGKAGRDSLKGGSGRDWLRGGASDDTLLGQGNDDILLGGAGQDVLTGGRGVDMFIFRTLVQEGDRITDFNVRKDLLDLRKIFSQPQFAGAKSHALHDQLIQSVQLGSDTLIQIDIDGTGREKNFATLVTLQNTTASTLDCRNFVL